MSQAVHNPTQEFWQPPAAPSQAIPALENTCSGCGTEFMVGARFCHVCGATREPKAIEGQWAALTQGVEFLKGLELRSIQNWLQLPTASLIAFFAGLGCVLAAVAVGLLYSVQNLADFQAIQLWRIEWLLGALVAFVAGILLKSSATR